MAKKDYMKRAYGTEPTLDHLHNSSDLVWDLFKAVNWYRTNAPSSKKEKKWVLDYITATAGKKESANYSNGTSYQYDFISSYCRIASRVPSGIVIPDEFQKTIDKWLTRIKKTTAEKKASKQKDENASPKKSIQERIAEQVSEYIGLLDEKLDVELDNIINRRDVSFSVKGWLQSHKVKSVQARKIAEWFKPMAQEIEEAISGKCPQLNEGYDFLTKPQKKKYYKLIQGIINECTESAENTPKRTRKKKVKTPEQLVAKVKYEQSNKEYNISSINPTQIIGAKKLIAFNTKYRHLIVYETMDPGGFIIKGTTLQNYSKDLSKSKTLRKPKDILKNVTGGIRQFNNSWNSINAKEKTVNGRINSNTVLLKVHK